MINLKSTTITHSAVWGDFVLNDITSSLTADECVADISDAQGEIYLLVDGTKSTGSVTVTLYGGEGPAAFRTNSDYVLSKGSCKLIVLSSGERSRKDGTLHFNLQASAALNNQGLRIAVIKRRNVESH